MCDSRRAGVEAHITGSSARQDRRHRGSELDCVRRADDLHAWNCSHQGNVLDGLVGGAVGFGKKARNRSDELYREVANSDVGTYELERAQGEKRRERMAHGHATAKGEARGG